MATIQGTLTDTDFGRLAEWAGLGDADEGTPVAAPRGLSHMGFMARGTIGGATVALQGSNDGSNWFDTTVTLSSEGIADVSELGYQHYRPATTGGTGTDVTATLFIRER